ncbi:MAG TPA: heme ABC exporter ATP-binding protein CcmA [Devosiaceae bacterium]
MNPPLAPRRLVVADLACRRGEREIFTGLSFTANPGEIVLLRGPNGAGKSTLLLALCGFLTPAAGRIDWQGGDPERDFGEDLHFIGHLSAIKPSLTLAENLEFWADMLGGMRERVASALDLAGLGGLADYPASVLSAGQSRRLALARLLVAPRPVWLLDEPTAALDSAGDRWVASLIDEHVANGGIAIAATHLDLALTDASRLQTLRIGSRQQ